jgi:UDP-glucose 4-epimerase
VRDGKKNTQKKNILVVGRNFGIYINMKALVTGGSGFIGTNLIKKLSYNNHIEFRENIVVSIDNYSTGLEKNDIDCPGIEYHFVDITEHTNYSFLIQDCDVIFHLAALPRIQPSFETPTESFKSNVLGTMNILEWARKNGNIPVIYAGSSSTHGGVYSNPYTHTKWQGEELCKMYNKIYDLPVTICRFYNVYGPHQLTEGEYCTVLGIFENQVKQGLPLTITGDGEQRRDFTHVDDIVDGLVRCYLLKGYNEFELGRGKNYSINEIADAFGDHPREYVDEWLGEMRETLCTDTKAKEELGWKPTRDIIEYIKETNGL